MKRIALFGFLAVTLSSLALAGPDTRGVLELEGYGNNGAVGITAKKTRNDFTIKETLGSGDSLFYIKSYGYNGVSMSTNAVASIEFNTNQAFTSSANGTKIVFKTTPDGSVTPATAMTIENSGVVTFATYNQVYNRTSAQIKVTTPTAVGLEVFDTTLKQPIWSSGTTTCFDWVTSTGTRPSGY